MTVSESVSRVLAADHAAARGHFPGNPVIPGAVLLDAVLEALGGGAPGCVIESAKFLYPVRPGDCLDIGWTAKEGGATRFECRVQGRIVLAGSLRLHGS